MDNWGIDLHRDQWAFIWIQKTGYFNDKKFKYNDLDRKQKEQREAHYLMTDLRFYHCIAKYSAQWQQDYNAAYTLQRNTKTTRGNQVLVYTKVM